MKQAKAKQTVSEIDSYNQFSYSKGVTDKTYPNLVKFLQPFKFVDFNHDERMVRLKNKIIEGKEVTVVTAYNSVGDIVGVIGWIHGPKESQILFFLVSPYYADTSLLEYLIAMCIQDISNIEHTITIAINNKDLNTYGAMLIRLKFRYKRYIPSTSKYIYVYE